MQSTITQKNKVEKVVNNPQSNCPISVFKDPISIPKGSIITTDIIYDNSEFNLTNPDPSIDLRKGPSVVLNENYLPRFLYTEIK